MKIFFYTFLAFAVCVPLLPSCQYETASKSLLAKIPATPAIDTLQSNIRPGEKLQLGTIYTDDLEYISFSDDYDDSYMLFKKGKDSVSLIYNEEQPAFVRGDRLRVRWKMDSLRPAGDPEFLDFVPFVVSAKVVQPLQLKNHNTKVLWRNKESAYDDLELNQDYLKNITDPEKAALGYVATFIGNDCDWDGDSTENLKCKIISAVGLGSQCSTKHLEFLRHWFRKDKNIVQELENCPKTPVTATVQETFNEIYMKVDGKRITVSFKANGVNLRAEQSWSWSEEQVFDFKEGRLAVVSKKKSDVKKEMFK